MNLTEELLSEAESFVEKITVTSLEAAEYMSECRRFGCGYGDD